MTFPTQGRQVLGGSIGQSHWSGYRTSGSDAVDSSSRDVLPGATCTFSAVQGLSEVMLGRGCSWVFPWQRHIRYRHGRGSIPSANVFIQAIM